MSAQPKALFLADVIESDPASKLHHDEAAAELRRLHAEVERLSLGSVHTCHAECQRPVCRLTRERNALLEALKMIAGMLPCADNLMSDKDIARAAIKAVGGEKT